MNEQQADADWFSNFTAIFDNSEDAIINKKSNGEIVNWNKSAERIFGYTAPEAIGKNIAIIVPSELAGEESDITERLKQGERVQHYKCNRLARDGRIIPISLTVTAVNNGLGDFVGATIIARDITTQKTFDEKQAMLAAIVDSSDDAIISKTLKGFVTSWNKSAEKMFGYTEAEALGRHISMLIPPDRIDEENHIISSIKKGDKIEHYKTIRQTKEGKLIPISLTVSPIRDSSGIIIGASKIARDISEQQTGEEKRVMYAAIIDSSEDAIVSKTLEGIITSWNKAAAELFGYAANEAIGKHITLIIPKDRLDEEVNIISRIKSGQRIDHFETLRQRKDGQLIPISLSVSPIKDSTGKIIGASKIARDITEEIEIRKKIKLYYEQLEKVNSYKDEFIGLASHELKTPLTSISGYLQLLEMTLVEEKPKVFIKRAVTQAKKLSSLVSDLLDMSKIQTGKLPLKFEEFEFNEVLNDVIITTNDTLITHKVEVITNAQNIVINGDKQRIEQVLINLITNAVKYSPKADKVIVTVDEINNNVRVSVKDFGIGIAADQQEKIFSRFYRVEGTGPSFSGLGIGLYISKDIISKHKGRIWIESEPGHGSTFYFELPRHQ